MPARFGDTAAVMARALELAARGIGSVEPNPPVGAVLVDDHRNLIAEGWHQRFGGPHAEIEAIAEAGERARGATLFVSLEPCSHQGKTGPCTEAIVRVGIRKVVVALRDPFPEVDGKGIERLRSLGIEVEVGLLAKEAAHLAAPFLKLITTARPWVRAKWAMSLDGKIATHAGDSRWISNEMSRAVVHRLRGRMDAIVVGAGTALRDDPLLTARPAGPRIATRIVVDSQAGLPVTSQLVQTAREVPLLVAASSKAPLDNVRRLEEHGAEVVTIRPEATGERSQRTGKGVDVDGLLAELGRRHFTNILVEGGSRLFGSLFDGGHVDEVHVFVAAKIIGGTEGPSAVGGLGLAQMDVVSSLESVAVERIGDDVYISGRRSPA
jgi:diaminohydroxyphosphoribosylaminopyrimidine deaminase / 5-amino-6-(5-phosphoribosylamino)uracil reductase